MKVYVVFLALLASGCALLRPAVEAEPAVYPEPAVDVANCSHIDIVSTAGGCTYAVARDPCRPGWPVVGIAPGDCD